MKCHHRFSTLSSLIVGLLTSTVLIPAAALAAEAAGVDPLDQVVSHVKQSRKQYEDEKSIANEVRLASWLVMFAELASDREDLGLWSRASDAFDEGMGHIAQVQLAISKDPKLEQQLAKEPALAMRLDAVGVRKEQIDKRQQLARTQEGERLNQLRGLVLAYRDLTQKMAMSNVSFLWKAMTVRETRTIRYSRTFLRSRALSNSVRTTIFFQMSRRSTTVQTSKLSARCQPPYRKRWCLA